MSTVLLIIHLFVTITLIGVVLIQRSEGGGLGIGSSQGMGSFMSGRGTANLLTRATALEGCPAEVYFWLGEATWTAETAAAQSADALPEFDPAAAGTGLEFEPEAVYRRISVIFCMFVSAMKSELRIEIASGVRWISAPMRVAVSELVFRYP